MYKNNMKITVPAIPENESFLRNVVAGLAVGCNPSIDIISDIKTCVSEAVTNAIVHAYDSDIVGKIELEGIIDDDTLTITIKDYGKGIKDVDKAMETFFTTNTTGERSGLGFTIMQTFMDKLEVHSTLEKGTTIIMKKKII